MALGRYHILGGARIAKLTGSTLGPTGLSFTVDDASGWPTGGANGKIPVVLAPGSSNEEHCLAQSRSGVSFTIASVGDRGVDGTAAGTHAADTLVQHGFLGQMADEANAHVNNTALDDHPQYLNSVRHAAILHTSAMLGANSVTSSQIGTGAVGADELADNSVDANAIQALAVTSGKLGANSVIAGKLADGAVDTSGRFAAGVVNSAALAASAVIAGKIAAGGVSATSQIADGIVSLAKFASEASTAFVPSFGAVTLGTGGIKWGQYFKIGRLVVGIAGFRLGTGGNVTGALEYSAPIGTVADYISAAGVTGWITAGRCFDISANVVFSGMGQITDSGTITDWATAGFSATWDATAPFNWDTNDSLQTIFFYETT